MKKYIIFGLFSGLAYASFMVGYYYFKGELFSFIDFLINFIWFGGAMIVAEKINKSK